MKEALEKIRIVEEKNQAASLALVDEMNRYQEQKKVELQALENTQKELRKKTLTDLENELAENENQYKMFLQQQTTENNQKNEALYKKHKDTFRSAQAHIRAGLAPVYPQVIISSRLCSGTRPISFCFSKTATFSPSNDKYLSADATYKVLRSFFMILSYDSIRNIIIHRQIAA